MNQAPGRTDVRGFAAADWGLQAALAMLRRMLDSADDVLFDLSNRTMTDAERRSYFEAMRLIRKSGGSIARGFEQALRPGDVPPAEADPHSAAPIDAKTLSLRADEDVEHEITVSNTVGRVENSAQQMLWEYGLRLENISRPSEIRDRLEALRPKTLISAFHTALQSLDLEPDIRLTLVKLFERQLLADVNAFFENLNTRLESEGITDKAVPVRRRADARSAGGAAGAGGGGGGFRSVSTPTPSYSVSSNLVNSLSNWGVPASEWGAMPEAPSAYTAGAPQRLTLVNQLVEETGSRWPRGEMDALRRLILPIIQIALSDSNFFADAAHPARQLISGLETAAAEPEEARGLRLAETETALLLLQQQYSAPSRVEPLSPAELQGFLTAQRSPKASTSARITSARAAAHEQIKTAGSGYDLPVGLAPFLNEVWMPLVSAISLRFGVGTPEWKRSMELLQHLFGECRWLTGGAESTMVDTILDAVSGEMEQMGVPPNLVQRASTLLRDGLSNPAQAAERLDLETFGARPRGGPAKQAAKDNKAPPPPPDRLVDWRAAMPVGAWFRVFDRDAERTVWMNAEVFYPEAPTVSFTGFDPEVRVNVRKVDFLADLRDGKAEAVNPSEAQSEAIARLVASVTKKAAA